MTIHSEMERLGRILAADQGLKVHVRGTKAHSVPGEVTIPNLPSFAMLGRQAKRMLHGLLDHETGHAFYTDHNCMAAARKDDALLRLYGIDPTRVKPFRKILGSAFNTIEDGWMEQAQARRWPGARVNMHQKNLWFWDTDTTVPSLKKRLHTEEPVFGYFLALCMISRKTKTLDEVWEASPPKVRELIEHTADLIERIDPLRNSLDALRLAVDLCERIHERFEEPPPPPESDDAGEDEGEGDCDDGEEPDSEPGEDDESEGSEGPSEGASSEDDPEDQDDQGSPQNEPEGEGEDESEADSGEGESDESEEGDEEGEDESDAPIKGSFKLDLEEWDGDGRPLSPEDLVDIEVQAALDRAVDPYVVFSHEWDIEVDMERTDLQAMSHEAEEVRRDAEAAESSLIQAFEAALRAQREMRPIPGNDEGDVDPVMLSAYALGAAQPDELFMQYVQEDDRDVAVSILVDCSGSMGSARAGQRSKSFLAKRAVYSMSRALSAVAVPHEVLGFTCVGDRCVRAHYQIGAAGMAEDVEGRFREMRQALAEAEARGEDLSRFVRCVHQDSRGKMALQLPVHSVFKSFGSDELRALAHITGIHANLDGEAVLWAARRLAARPEPRRVLFVLSDGAPTGAPPHISATYLAETIEAVTAAGIETHGIGMNTRAVERFYPSNIVVADMDDLADQALTQMIEVLTQARQEHVWTHVA
jgi:cobalamin biosynthesis protein CobT